MFLTPTQVNNDLGNGRPNLLQHTPNVTFISVRRQQAERVTAAQAKVITADLQVQELPVVCEIDLGERLNLRNEVFKFVLEV